VYLLLRHHYLKVDITNKYFMRSVLNGVQSISVVLAFSKDSLNIGGSKLEFGKLITYHNNG